MAVNFEADSEQAPVNLKRFQDLIELEESQFTDPQLRARYHREMRAAMQYANDYMMREAGPDVYDDPLLKNALAHIGFYADRLIQLTTNITPGQARRGVLLLELSQYPTDEQLPAVMEEYKLAGMKVGTGRGVVSQVDGATRYTLVSPIAQKMPTGRAIEAGQWLHSTKRLFHRLMDILR